MPFTTDAAKVAARLRREAQHLTDQTARRLVEAWVRAWDSLSVDFEAAIADLITSETDGMWPSRAQVARAERAARALEHAAHQLDSLAEIAHVDLDNAVMPAVHAAIDGERALIGAQLPEQIITALAVAFDRVPEAAIDAIVLRAGQRITSALRPLSGDALEAIRLELIRGVILGDNPRTAAAAMLARVQGAFNGGLTRALTIARTEILDAYRAGALAQRQQATDVVTGWRWLTDLSTRSCPACLALNGSVHAANEAGPHGHQNCRCTAVPITKSWTELGITGVDEPPDVFPDARAWFDGLPAATQNRMMGPTRAAGLRDGSIGWDDLATQHTNPGWRDSWTTTPLRDLVA